jgi:hypothetical protein
LLKTYIGNIYNLLKFYFLNYQNNSRFAAGFFYLRFAAGFFYLRFAAGFFLMKNIFPMCNMQINYTLIANFIVISKGKQWGRRGRDRLVVGFTTTHVQ